VKTCAGDMQNRQGIIQSSNDKGRLADEMSLNIVTVIVLILAVVVFIQLRSVLGRRTGNERPPFDPYSRPSKAETEVKDNVVTLPSRGAARDEEPEVPDFSDIDEIAPQGEALNDSLRAIRGLDPNFSPVSFCRGASLAYEAIMDAFARGEREVLVNLLEHEVFDGFCAALDEREQRGEQIKFSFVGMKSIDIADAVLRETVAEIIVSISCEIISATYDREGTLIEGNEGEVVEIHDRWTFMRDLGNEDPNWLLCATDDDEDA